MSVPAIAWMREKYFLRGNPFPPEAIMAEGSGEPCEDGTIFDPNVNLAEVTEFFQKFVVRPAYDRGSSFGALWSLGAGEGARGFGKSSLGQYGARRVCADFGLSVLKEYGSVKAEDIRTFVASYSRFDRNNVTNFHAVAFELVRWLTEKKRDMYETCPIVRLRQRIVEKLAGQELSYAPGSDQEKDAIVEAVQDTRTQIPGTKIAPLNEEFLRKLASTDIVELKNYLENVGTWHRIRNGFSYLDTVLTFAKAAGVSKAILFIDQVEDFANTGVPLYKRIREVERFRDIVKETAPFNSMTYFILTMHPDALGSISREWENARLPSISYDVPENRNRVVVLREIQAVDDAERLFKAYLNYPEYRIQETPDALHPFTSEAVATIQQLNGGRSGYMLRQANQILEIAAVENRVTIDGQYVSTLVSKTSSKKPSQSQQSEPELHKSLE